MNRDQALAILRRNQAQLRQKGVVRAALFGSTARGEAKAGSDLDILVDLDPAAPMDVFDYVGVVQFIEALFPVRVDVANHAQLKPSVRPSAERDALYAF